MSEIKDLGDAAGAAQPAGGASHPSPAVSAKGAHQAQFTPGPWRDMQTAPRDGRDLLLFHEVHGAIQGRFAPGEWSADTPISPAEYSGAVWVLGDDLEQEEVEELPEGAPLGLRYHDGRVIGWLPNVEMTNENRTALAAASSEVTA